MAMAPFPDTHCATGAPTGSEDAWPEARRRHHLARCGLITWQVTLPPTRPVVRPLHDEETRAVRDRVSSAGFARRTGVQP